MANKQTYALTLIAAMAVGLTACHDDLNPWNSGAQGTIAPNVTLNTAVESSRKAPAARAVALPGDVSIEDLALTITKTDNSYSHTWTSVADFDVTQQFSIGEYTIEAVYGDVNKEGFACPAFYGSQTISVRENETTNVALTATLANAMVSIEYTEAFTKYMDDWDANIHSDGGTYVYFANNETRPGYVKPGPLSMSVYFQKPGGQTATLQVASFNAEARHHYHMTVDLNDGDGGGNAVLVIIYDESLDKEDVLIELSDEIMNSPAPTVVGDGNLQNGSVFTYVEGDIWDSPLKANITAPGGIQSVILTTSSKSLLAQGWPAEVDLVQADAVMQARLQQMGFNCRGLWNNPGTMAVLDFTDVINHINAVDAEPNNFTISVVDKNGKVNEPFSFAVNTTALLLEISNPGALTVGASELTVDLKFNGTDPSKLVKFQYFNDRGTWTALTATNFEATADATVYNVTLSVPADSKPLSIRAITDKATSNTIDVTRSVPQYTLNVDNADVWAKKATLSITSNEVDANLLASSATVYLSVNGGAFATVIPKITDNRLLLEGLTPGTKYSVKTTVNGNPDQCCTPIDFTTETAAGVPNGDFETLTATVSANSMNQGGKWSISAGINYQTTVTYAISEPNNWASVNAKTTSSSTANSWFRIPAVFNSTLTWSSTVPSIHVVNIGGGTDTPDTYKNIAAQSGTNAMVLRNVGWDPAGSVPGVWKKDFASQSEYYNHNEASTSQVSAGKMFLGSYSYDANSQTETYNYGVNFTSRPAALTGWYKYVRDAQDPNENALVKVEVLSGNTVIASETINPGPADGYTQFRVPLHYIDNAGKATSVRIMLASSQYASESQSEETARIKVTTYMSRYETGKHGATFTVDNLTFEY